MSRSLASVAARRLARRAARPVSLVLMTAAVAAPVLAHEPAAAGPSQQQPGRSTCRLTDTRQINPVAVHVNESVLVTLTISWSCPSEQGVPTTIRQMNIVDSLTDVILYQTGSGSPEPTVRGQELTWTLGAAGSQTVKVSYRARPTQTGEWMLTTTSGVQFRDSRNRVGFHNTGRGVLVVVGEGTPLPPTPTYTPLTPQPSATATQQPPTATGTVRPSTPTATRTATRRIPTPTTRTGGDIERAFLPSAMVRYIPPGSR